MRYKLIIFDCDGVLVNTEGLTARTFITCANELGAHFTLAEVESFNGGKMADLVLALESKLGHKTEADFVPKFRAKLAEVFKKNLQAVDGIQEVLAQINVPICVASSGPREKIQLTLGITGLLPRFEGRIYSAYDIQKWKPDPGIFLHAAASFNLNPNDCAVIEDSLFGIQAGVAAGMNVFAYCPLQMKESFAAAGALPFHRMQDLLGLL